MNKAKPEKESKRFFNADAPKSQQAPKESALRQTDGMDVGSSKADESKAKTKAEVTWKDRDPIYEDRLGSQQSYNPFTLAPSEVDTGSNVGSEDLGGWIEKAAIKAAKDLERFRPKFDRRPHGTSIVSWNGTATGSGPHIDVHKKMKKYVKDKTFELTCAAVITANTFSLAFCTNQEVMQAVDGDRDPKCDQAYHTAELVFVIWYTIEVILRIMVDRWRFLYGSDWRWNTLDVVLVISALQEHILTATGGAGVLTNLSYLRLTRLAKMFRVIKLMRSLRELRMMLNSILGSMMSMFWSVILVSVILFLTAVVFVQAATTWLSTPAPFGEHKSDELELVYKYFRTLPIAMENLWFSTTGGIDYYEMTYALWYIGPVYAMFFHVYVAFFLFVIANAMTSLFVDGARRWSERDHQQVIQNQLHRKDEYRRRVSQLYHHMDRGQKGDVSYEEFVVHLSDPRLAAFAESLEIDTMDLQQFFTILSAGGRRRVDLDTFVIGCIKLRGMAKSMDLIDLLLAHRSAIQDTNMFYQACDLKLDNLEYLLGRLLGTSSEREEFDNLPSLKEQSTNELLEESESDDYMDGPKQAAPPFPTADRESTKDWVSCDSEAPPPDDAGAGAYPPYAGVNARVSKNLDMQSRKHLLR